jgi:hypothetical protein
MSQGHVPQQKVVKKGLSACDSRDIVRGDSQICRLYSHLELLLKSNGVRICLQSWKAKKHLMDVSTLSVTRYLIWSQLIWKSIQRKQAISQLRIFLMISVGLIPRVDSLCSVPAMMEAKKAGIKRPLIEKKEKLPKRQSELTVIDTFWLFSDTFTITME